MDFLKFKWNIANYKLFINYFKDLGENDYKKLNEKIIFTKYEIIGIRLPKLRAISKEISKGDYKSYLSISNNNYYEEVMIKLLVIANIKDLEECIYYFDKSINLIDNWALCDTFCNSLKIVNKNKDYFFSKIKELVNSKETYFIRVGFILLLNYYVEEKYLNDIFTFLDYIKSDEYYVNMAKAWLVCEIFIKYEKLGFKYLKNNKLDKFTQNKSISKIRDSLRVSKEMKNYVLKFRK